MTLLAYENDVTRTLFTKSIVGEERKWLHFDEKWEETDVIAAPCPPFSCAGRG